ncbi:DNA-3-methyladenine glycosylase [mine drainage metagenome]|jgi:DNA-3-methyladenine glycosylase II|uniref:DNA-3-methyladenine glycosylase n=1 Tax=mine drainage metagenome TaxID=410659 RepID=A0A1J5QJ23_9ZZZZ
MSAVPRKACASTSTSSERGADGAGAVLLHPRAPFRLDLTVWSLRRQPRNAIDRWDGRHWRRVLLLDGVAVELSVCQVGAPDAPTLELQLRGDAPIGSTQREAARDAVSRMLGLDVDLDAFYRMAAADSRLGELAERCRGMRPQRFPDLFEALANAVACQQVSLSSGIALLGRFGRRWGRALAGDAAAYAFPSPRDLRGATAQALRAEGWSARKAEYLLGIADALADGAAADALHAADDAAALAALQRLRGVGRWSAQYALLRGLGRCGAFPVDDVGAQRHLGAWLGLPRPPDAAQTAAIVSRWQPYAGLVYFHLLLWRLEREGALTL